MLARINQFKSCSAYVRSVAHRSTRCPSANSSSTRLKFPRSVMIVEFRDEVYASLHRVLSEEGFLVTRAETAAEVAIKAKQLPGGLVLINEAMPGESGWLISSKLHLSDSQCRVWVYSAKHLRYLQDWQNLASVEFVLSYGGDLLRLIRTLRAQVRLQHQPIKRALPHSAVSNAIQEAFPNRLPGLPAMIPGLIG